jgi:hypothetical protein
MLPSLFKVWIVVDFEINKDKIAKTLCINKEKPITICGGSCYLSDQLSKAEEPETKQLPKSVKVKVELTYFVSKESDTRFSTTSSSVVRKTPFKPAHYLNSYLEDIFHPPQAA